ncbi:MAG: hypothetical protein HY471_02190 [Candidatus Sungbacteria bacterium]|nr:hypothetical protein [Candidatus Sungbacteria bacterium]
MAVSVSVFPDSLSAAAISLTGYASATPAAPVNGDSVAIHATVKNLSDVLGGTIVDIEIHNLDTHTKVFQQFFDGQNFGHLESKTYTVHWTPNVAGRYKVKIGVFAAGWSSLHYWKDSAIFFLVPDSASSPVLPSRHIEAWWPTENAVLLGLQPFKAILSGSALDEYEMFWRVDGGIMNPMYDSSADYPHKEAMVNVAGWNWRGVGPYTIDFLAREPDGRTITFKTVQVMTN